MKEISKNRQQNLPNPTPCVLGRRGLMSPQGWPNTLHWKKIFYSKQNNTIQLQFRT